MKCAVFDFDGTLFDTMKIWDDAGALFLKNLGKSAEANLGQTLKSMSLTESAEFLNNQYDLKMSCQQIISGILNVIEHFYLFEALPKKNAFEFLCALKENGFRLCIATASDKRLIEKALERCKMRPFFEKIITCEEVGHSKHAPDIFREAAKYFGADKSETIVFEDALFALETAKKDGFFTVGVFDESEENQEALKITSDFYIETFSTQLAFELFNKIAIKKHNGEKQ